MECSPETISYLHKAVVHQIAEGIIKRQHPKATAPEPREDLPAGVNWSYKRQRLQVKFKDDKGLMHRKLMALTLVHPHLSEIK